MYMNPHYSTDSYEYIDLIEVETGRQITTSASDPDTSRIYANAIAGLYGDIAPYAPPKFTKDQLKQYASQKASTLLLTTRTLAITGNPTIQVLSDASDGTLGALARLASWGDKNPDVSRDWVQNDNSSVSLTGEQLSQLYDLVSAFEQEVYTTQTAVIASINSTAITSPEQIDGYAWPA